MRPTTDTEFLHCKYTTNIYNLLASGITQADIFGFEYPKFSYVWNDYFENTFIDYYMFHELGLETFGRWRHYLSVKLNTIMPRYNQLLDTQKIAIEPLFNMFYQGEDDTTRDTTDVSRGDTEQNTTMSGDRTVTPNTVTKENNVFEDTPQGRLQTTTAYATNVTDNIVTRTGTEKSVGSDVSKMLSEFHNNTIGTDKSKFKTLRKGYQGISESELIAQYRAIIINPVENILQDLAPLFMQIF